MTLSANRKVTFPKTDSVNESALFFYLPNTHSVCNFSKNCQFSQNPTFPTQPPKHNCSRRFCYFPFFFSYFVFLRHEKGKNKNSIFVLKTSCLTLRQFAKTLFIRVGFWQNGFFADFNFWATGFLRGFSRRIFLLIFVGIKKCPQKSSRKIPGKIL